MSVIQLRSEGTGVRSTPDAGDPQPATVPGRPGAVRHVLPALAALLAAAGLAIVVGTALVNGDSVWHLIWGRELARGDLDSFTNGPTPHPLLVLSGAVTSVLGDDGSFAATYVLFGPLAAGGVVAAVVAITRHAGSIWAAVVAVLVLATSLPVLATAGTARYDIVFAALVLGAVVLEIAKPKRGTVTLCCLAVAGLIRPEAWVLAGVYWLWVAPGMTLGGRVRAAALVAVAPALWVLMDVAVMGDPLYSLHVTDRGSDAYYRQFTPGENLAAAWRNFVSYVGVIPIAAAVPGVVLLVRDRSRAAIPLLGTLGVTLGIFLLFLSQGLASSERYLFVPACIFALLAAVAATGGTRRTPARVMLAVLVSVFALIQVGARADVYDRIARDASEVEARNSSARELMRQPGVRAAMRSCGTVGVPSGRMIHLFAYYSGRSPDRFSTDERGRTRPDLYVAPADAQVAKDVLTRSRFDDDPSFIVPPSLRPGPRNADWILLVSPGSGCARELG